MVQSVPTYVTFEDYLEAEQSSDVKHEWLDGVVYAMGGGTVEHGRLAARMIAVLSAALEPDCKVYSSDVMIFVRETNLCTYPDGSVTCGPVDIQRVERQGRVLGEAITNPTLVVEVLSQSTEKYDRHEKLAHYMRVPSLKEYVLVSQDERRIEVFRRPDLRGHWAHEIAHAGGTFVLHGKSFPVDSIYA